MSDEALIGAVRATVEEIEDTRVETILDNALEIQRVQTLIGGHWETTNYILVMTVGGPHIEYDLDRSVVDGYWSSDEAHLPVDRNKSQEIYDYLEDFG